MSKLYFDIETYSECPIKYGTYRYAEDSTTEVLITAWAFEDDAIQVSEGLPDEVLSVLDDPSVVKCAWNTSFERVVLSPHCGRDVGSYLDVEQWDDPMARAKLYGYPGTLAGAGEALLGVEDRKDTRGKKLIRLFSEPDRRKGRASPLGYPDDWKIFKEYCRQDVHTLRELDRIIPAMSDKERSVWLATERINDRGAAVDLEMARLASRASAENKKQLQQDMAELTGLENPNSPTQLCGWLTRRLVSEVTSVAKGEVEMMLKRDDLPEDVRSVLVMRQALGLTAAKKFDTFQEMANSDKRLRGVLRYHGAHSGRWTAKGLNLQNLPHDKISETDVEAMRVDLLLGRTPPEEDLKKLVRPTVRGGLCVVDFSQIEARVLPWIAGDERTLDAFRAGRDLYTEVATAMGPSFSRQDGKVATLACGYGGGWRALLAFGGANIMPDYNERYLELKQHNAPDKEFVRLDRELRKVLESVVKAWRDSHPEIVRLWYDLENDLVPAEKWFTSPEKGVRGLVLPSGRQIMYRDIRGRSEETPWGDVQTRYTAADERGGRLTLNRMTLSNNLVQGTARDILAEAVIRLDKAGYRVVNMVHDEVLVEAPESELPEVIRLMTKSPSWACDLPISADGYYCENYVKK